MKDSYSNSSWGWDPAEKKDELFHPDARYLLLYTEDQRTNLVGFTGFRFDMDEEHAVLYW